MCENRELMKDVSIIIVNYHSANLVIDAINSVFEKTQGLTYEIIVVDNDSRDGSVELLKKTFGDKIKLIASDVNLGFGKANNLGARVATGEYLFLLNPDTVLVNNAIKILIDYYKLHPDVGVVGANLYGPDMSAAPSYCLSFDDIKSECSAASWFTILGKKTKEKLTVLSQREKKPFANSFNYSGIPMEVAYIFGADMLVKRSLFEQVKGFDPAFFMYAEEEELTWRIFSTGKKIVSVPAAKIIHLEGMTLKAQNAFSEKQFRMRMNGTMTYFSKRFGLEGVHQFYKYRTLQYDRLILIAKLRRKDLSDYSVAIQRKCLEDVYREFMELWRED